MPTSRWWSRATRTSQTIGDAIARVADLMNAKYGGITAEFLASHATIRVRPRWAFAIAHEA